MENQLNGFETIFDTLNNSIGKEDNQNAIDADAFAEELTDEELEVLKNGKDEKLGEEIDIEPDTKKSVDNKKDKKDKVEGPDDKIDESNKDEDDDQDNESDVVLGFFDAISEKIGWDFDESDEKPKTVEELVTYFLEVIQENSIPVYANEEIAKLDLFVKDGGDIKTYLTINAELDLETIDTEDEHNQKLLVKELLKEKGFSVKQIEKKLSKYEEAGLLEDEAEDAMEALKEIRTTKKEQLLTSQQNAAIKAKKDQQEFFNNVVTEIKGMKDIRGIAIPEKDKSVLIEYIFKQDADGKSKYQKDYAKNLKNLLESAYFTMKGDTLLNVAKSEGKKDAINKFKDSLKNNSGVDKKSKKEIKTSDDSLWSSFTRQLRVA